LLWQIVLFSAHTRNQEEVRKKIDATKKFECQVCKVRYLPYKTSVLNDLIFFAHLYQLWLRHSFAHEGLFKNSTRFHYRVFSESHSMWSLIMFSFSWRDVIGPQLTKFKITINKQPYMVGRFVYCYNSFNVVSFSHRHLRPLWFLFVPKVTT
jgi:hypothetical protein